jgi:Zn-dependent M28 family amino/carboxypeptidase
MVNMDMVGRNDAGAISVIGGGFSPELKALVEDVAPTVGLKPDFEDGERQGLLGRSDQASFYNRGVPILFFFSGFHDDYHRPTDTPDKIGTDKVARVARMAFAVTWRVAERTSRPKLVRPAPNR